MSEDSRAMDAVKAIFDSYSKESSNSEGQEHFLVETRSSLIAPASSQVIGKVASKITLFVYHTLSKRLSYTGFDTHLMQKTKILNATSTTPTSIATVEFSLHIDSSLGNINGVMHGGAAGVIFDMFTTTALGPIAREGYWDFLGGVTRTLNISYLKAVPIGTTIKVKSEVMQVGRTMAMIRGTMMSMDEKLIYATCEHHKVGVPTRKEHLIPEGVERKDSEKAKL